MKPTVTNEPSVAQRDADRTAEEQPPGHVGRVMHAQVRARHADESRDRRQTRSAENADAELSPGDGDEREQHRGMTARPRRCARFSDEKSSSFAIVEVRTRAADDSLQPLTREPRQAGSGEAAGGCTTAAPDGEHRGSPGRCPDRSELSDAAKYGVGGGTAIPVQLLERLQVELAALWRRRPRGHAESGSGESDGL